MHLLSTAITSVAFVVTGVAKAGESSEASQAYCPACEISRALNSSETVVAFPDVTVELTVIPSPLTIWLPSESSQPTTGVSDNPSSFVTMQVRV